jgi:hypothetical protein
LPAATLPPTGGVQQGDSNNETPTALAETPVATAEDSPDGTATAIVALDEAIPCPARMEIGQTARCSIDQPAEVDVYRLTITKTQHLQIRLASSVESIWTGVKVIDSQGNTICQQSKAVSAEIADCELQPGDYGIFIQDAYNGTRTGEYHLHITSLNDLTAATPITFQQTLVGEIKYPAEVDRFVFHLAAHPPLSDG